MYKKLMSQKKEFSTGNEFCFVELVGNGAYELLRLMSKDEVATLLDDYQENIDNCKVGDVIRIQREIYGIPYIIQFRKETEDSEEMLQNILTRVYPEY